MSSWPETRFSEQSKSFELQVALLETNLQSIREQLAENNVQPINVEPLDAATGCGHGSRPATTALERSRPSWRPAYRRPWRLQLVSMRLVRMAGILHKCAPFLHTVEVIALRAALVEASTRLSFALAGLLSACLSLGHQCLSCRVVCKS